MKNHVISLLQFLSFEKSFLKEKRLVFKELPSTEPEAAKIEKQEVDVRKYQRERQEKTEITAKTIDTANPVENVLDQLTKVETEEAKRQDIFTKLLKGEEIDLGGEPPKKAKIELTSFSEFQFLGLLKIGTEKLSAKKDENLKTVFDKIKPEGPFNVLQIGRVAMEILFAYAETQPDKDMKVKQLMEVVAKSPTRLSELIEMYGKDPAKLEELLKKLDGGYVSVLKNFITNYSRYVSLDALAILINNWRTFMNESSGFDLKNDALKVLPLSTKVDLIAGGKIKDDAATRFILDDLETHMAELLDQPILLEKLFRVPELKSNFIAKSVAAIGENPKLTWKLPTYLTTEIINNRVQAQDDAFLEKFIENIRNSTKTQLIDIALKPNGVGEKILVKLNPEFGKAIEKLQLVRFGEEFRGTSKSGTLETGTYYFQSSALDKVFRKDADSNKYSIKIEKLDDKPPVWDLDEAAAKPKTPEIKDFDIALVKSGTMIYENGADSTGKKLDKDSTFKIKKPIEIIAPSDANPTLKGIDCIRVLTDETPPKELLIKLSDINPEKVTDLFNKDLLTIRKLSLSQDDGKGIAIIDTGKRVTVTSQYPKTINGVECVKVRFHEQGKEGWAEKALLSEYQPTEDEKGMTPEMKQLRDKYFAKCSKVEETGRTLKTGIYHVNDKGTHTNNEGSEWNITNVKFDVKEPKVYKVTEKFTDPKDPTKVLEEDVRYVVKFENARIDDGSKTSIPDGYIDVDSLIPGEDMKKLDKPEHITYDKTEWSGEQKYKEGKSIPKGDYTTKNTDAFLLGSKSDAPEKVKRLDPGTQITALSEQIRIVDNKEYVNITAKTKDGDLNGWVLLDDINVNEAQLSSGQSAVVLEKEDIGLIKKDDVLKPIAGQENTYTVDFKYKTGEKAGKEVNKKLERDTKLSNIFPTAINGDKLEITHGGETKSAEFYNGNFYYLNTDGTSRTNKRAVILDGDTVAYKLRNTVSTISEETDGSGFKTVKFRNPDGSINKGLERNARLRDMLDTSKLVDGDRVFIIKKGSKTQTIATFIKEDGDGGNFYFTAMGKERGARAPILDGDKIKLEPKEETSKSLEGIVGEFELPKKGETRFAYVQRIYKEFPQVKEAAEANKYSENEYYEFLMSKKAADRFHMQIILPPAKYEVKAGMDRVQKEERSEAYAIKQSKKAQGVLEKNEHYYNDSFGLNEDLFKTLTKPGALDHGYGIMDERWNDLWEQRGEFKDKHIKGLDKVKTLLGNFGLTEPEMRDSLRTLIQTGLDDRVDFTDVFYQLCRKMYTQRYKEHYGKEVSSWTKDINIFKEDIDTQKKIITEWESGSKKEDKTRIEKFYTYDKKMKAAEQKAAAQGTLAEFRDMTPGSEYSNWQKQIDETAGLRKNFENEYVKASDHLNFLVYNILLPSAELLEAIKGMEIGTSIQETTYQTFRKEIERAKEAKPAEVQAGTPPFYSLDQLTSSPTGDLSALKEPELKGITEEGKEKYAVTISTAAMDKFRDIAKKCGLKTPEKFLEDHILKLVFQLYGVKTLTQEGCLKKIKEKDNQLILVDLPKNFDEKNPQVAALFKEVQTTEDIDKKRDLVKETADSLDGNLKIMKKLSTVFGIKGPQVFVHWTEKFSKAFTGEDSRELDLTMADLGAGAVTEDKRNLFLNHMSGEAAMTNVLAKITKTENNVETLDKSLFIKTLKSDLLAGLKALPIFSYRSTDLKSFQETVERKGNLNDPKTFAMFEKNIEEFINNDKPLDEMTVTLIRLGHVANIDFEQGRDKDSIENEQNYKLSDNPSVRKIQELMIAERNKSDNLPYTKEDIAKIETACLFSVQGAVGTSGGTGGIGLGKSFDVGNGWSVGVGAGIGVMGGSVGGGAGMGVEKTIKLSKDGKTQLILGVDAGFPYAGGHAGIKFAISESWSMSVMVAAGWSPYTGDYEALGLSWQKEGEWERQAQVSKETTKIGADYVDNLISQGASEETIAVAITALPRIGSQFAILKSDYRLSNKAIIDLYKKEKTAIESEISKEVGGSGWGFGIGIVRISALPFPIPNLYVDIPVDKKVVVYRTVDKNTRSLDRASQDQVDQKVIQEVKARYGANRDVVFMDEKIENNGQYSYDVISGQATVLKDKQEINFGKYDKFEQLNRKLNDINIALVPDPKTGLTRIDINKRVGNVQFVKDPSMDEQLVVKDGATYLTMTDLSDLVITRENFFYPYPKDGTTELSIITIKSNNLKRTRDDIQHESPTFVYQRKGYQAEIRKGAEDEYLEMDQARKKEMPSILSYEDYQKQTQKLNLRDAGKVEELNRKHQEFEKTTGLIKERKPESLTVREGIIPATEKGKSFAEDFYKNFHKEYKKLSTRTLSADEQGHELSILINKYASTYKPKKQDPALGELNKAEMSATLTYLMTRSFLDVHGNQDKFNKDLEKFGEKVLTSFFSQSMENLLKLKPSIKIDSSANLMAKNVISDLRANTKLGQEPIKEAEIEINGEKVKVNVSEAGFALLSLVGTEGIVGLRGTPTYNKDVASGLLNFKQYRPGVNGIEGDIGKVLVEIMNPLNPEDNKEFMDSKLAITTITHPGIFLILGPDKAQKVAECFRDRAIIDKPGYKEAFEQFKRIVLAIRNAELTGKNLITAKDPSLKSGDLPNGYKIQIAKAPIAAMSVYGKCGNPTIAYQDSYINILSPKTTGVAKEGDVYETVTPETRIKVYNIRIGFSIIPEAETTTPKENQDAVGATATEDGTGANMQQAPGTPPPVIDGDAPVF